MIATATLPAAKREAIATKLETMAQRLGIGSIVEGIERAGFELWANPGPDDNAVRVIAVEINATLFSILAEKVGDSTCQHGSFLESNPPVDLSIGFDRVLMNPPFEKGQDIEHVMHAYKFLKPGGRLVAIVGAGALTNSMRKAEEFQHFLGRVNAQVIDVDPGAFNTRDTFRQTGVNVKIVVIDK